jgi:inhibitor of cysteine peptidase
LPSGQYSQVTLNTALVTFLNAMLGSRLTDNGSSFRSLPGYVLEVEGNGSWFLDSNGSFILGGSGLTFSIGDVFVLACVGSTIYFLQNSVQIGSVTNAGYSSGTSGLGTILSAATSSLQYSDWVVGSASLTGTYSISGNAGTLAGATVSYSGTAVGSVTTTAGGAYTISGLAAGNYTITPSLAGYVFSPTSQNETISSSNITGVNFTAALSSATWSPIDCRVNKPNSATFRTVQGAQICDVQTSSNPAVPGVDSRAAGKPQDCRVAPNIPENSRTFPPFAD